ncbi:MAG TPA: beta-L-arabinofuranosidase domain-containing protein [Candidatus Limnocylindrales bacterium]|nr:beta-L-arabinofuranosidase domain-containing protein [Candidatus Limnocylindrales bacterium]
MFPSLEVSRRRFLQSVSLAAAGMTLPGRSLAGIIAADPALPPLMQFDYGDVELTSDLHEQQLEETHRVLMGLSDDSLLKPFRQMSGRSAPGDDLGGWYHYDPDYVWGKDTPGFAPSCTFGQWVSALARWYAIKRDEPTRDKVLRLNRLYAQTISGEYYDKNRFPTYCYDKIVCGLIDSHKFAGDPDALAILNRTTDAALPHFPRRAIEHGVAWRPDKNFSWNWDESYTISENLFLAYQRGAGARYRELARRYLDDEYYNPLAEGRNVLAGRHAYSYVNSLSSAMQAYLTLGNEKYLRAARNAFAKLAGQSFVTGGWGPDETLRAPDSPDVCASLTNTHAGFETPCGSYAHFKLTRYLLRVTRDARYGDSMERVMYNTVLGAKPLMADGRTFYYSDYNFAGRKVYRDDQHWACCSGTLPQVATDYRINTYFRDPQGVWVNLYIPSTLRWTQDGAQITLTQESRYPFDSTVQFKVNPSQPRDFTLNFRIPAWASGASISINGRRWPIEITPGTFAVIHRQWNTGDRIELDLPMTTRLEPVDLQHPQIVAPVYGPVVLFAITDTPPSLTRADLLSAKRVDRRTWQVNTAGAPLKLLPFTDIGDEQYSTYLRVT